MTALFMVGCSANEEADSSKESEITEEAETGETQSESDNRHTSHQKGLKIGETGTVVSGTINDNRSYEITLNSVEYRDIVAGLEASEDTYAVVNITVTNTDDSAFNAKDIYGPAFGAEGELTATLNPVLFDHQDKVEEDILEEILEGEIAPGEEITGIHVFDIKQNDVYVFTIGGSGAQIITYAQWEVSDSEIEQ